MGGGGGGGGYVPSLFRGCNQLKTIHETKDINKPNCVIMQSHKF